MIPVVDLAFEVKAANKLSLSQHKVAYSGSLVCAVIQR